MRIISSKLHGLLDYAAATTLILAPFVLGLSAESPVAHWISVLAGAGLIIYSLITDYHFGIARAIPFKFHLALDLVAAVFFLLAPTLLGFSGVAEIYYYVMGAGVLAVVALTQAGESRAQSTSQQLQADA